MTQEMLDNQMRKTFTMRTRVNVLFTHAKWREPIGAQSKQITADWVRNQKKENVRIRFMWYGIVRSGVSSAIFTVYLLHIQRSLAEWTTLCGETAGPGCF